MHILLPYNLTDYVWHTDKGVVYLQGTRAKKHIVEWVGDNFGHDYQFIYLHTPTSLPQLHGNHSDLVLFCLHNNIAFDPIE